MHQPITGDEPANMATTSDGYIGQVTGLTIRQTMAKDFVAAILSSGQYRGDYAKFLSDPNEAASVCQDALMWVDATIKALNQPT